MLTKLGMFVGKVYANNGLFKLDVMAINPRINEMNNFSIYLFESLTLISFS